MKTSRKTHERKINPVIDSDTSDDPNGVISDLQLANDMQVEILPLTAVREPDRVIKPPSARAIATAKAMLEQFGQKIPIAVTDDGTIIVGLVFLVAARELGWKSIKAIRVSQLSREQIRVFTIALERLPELSKWDDVVLRLEFTDLLALDLDFDLHDVTGFSIGELDIILDGDIAAGKPDALDEIPDATVASQIVTTLGDLWLLGDHRLLCGNALEAEAYAKLFAGKRARLCLCDPPFNIKVENNVSGLGKIKHKDFAMAVGEMTFAEFSHFLKTFLLLTCAHLVDGALIYAFMDRRKLEELFLAAREANLSIIDLCFWNKGSGGMGSFYRSQHEPCAVFKSGNASYQNNVQLGRFGRYRTNVWDHPGLSSFGKGRKEALAFHPTVKPVNLLAEAIKDSTKLGEIVVDPFCGSGSTLIAAEKTGRIAYGIELERKYVDVTVARWESMTGKQVTHEASGLTFAQVRRRRLRQTVAPDALDMLLPAL